MKVEIDRKLRSVISIEYTIISTNKKAFHVGSIGEALGALKTLSAHTNINVTKVRVPFGYKGRVKEVFRARTGDMR